MAVAWHPDVTRVVAQMRAQGVRRYDELGVLASRSTLEGVRRLQRPALDVAEVRELLVPGPQGHLPARLYHPDPARRLPVLLYLHGGGWIAGSVRSADRPCRRLAHAGDCAVVSLEYRLAPETAFPGALEDCVAALRWLAVHAAELGGDGGPLTVMGDSAGGNLAAAVGFAAGDPGVPVARQILLYPCLAPARDSPYPSYADNADGPLMTRAELEFFWALYLRDTEDERDPRASPLAALDLRRTPATLIVIAELDPLRDEAIHYARRLREAGVPVEELVFPGAAHGFWWMDGEMRQADELDRELGRWLRAR